MNNRIDFLAIMSGVFGGCIAFVAFVMIHTALFTPQTVELEQICTTIHIQAEDDVSTSVGVDIRRTNEGLFVLIPC